MRESGHQGSYPQLQQVLGIFTQVEHYANCSKVYGKQGKYESENGTEIIWPRVVKNQNNEGRPLAANFTITIRMRAMWRIKALAF